MPGGLVAKKDGTCVWSGVVALRVDRLFNCVTAISGLVNGMGLTRQADIFRRDGEYRWDRL